MSLYRSVCGTDAACSSNTIRDSISRVGSVRTEVVQFVGFGGLATSLAPGRGTYGLVRSAAFQGCKDRRKILKWRHMRAFSGSVSEWCGRADAARKPPQHPPSDRAASARTQAASAPASARAWRPGSIRLASGQHPLGVRAASVSVGRLPARGSRAASAAPLSGAAPRLCGRFLSHQGVIREKPGEPGHRNIGRGSCRSALADGVERPGQQQSGTRLTPALGGGLSREDPPARTGPQRARGL